MILCIDNTLFLARSLRLAEIVSKTCGQIYNDYLHVIFLAPKILFEKKYLICVFICVFFIHLATSKKLIVYDVGERLIYLRQPNLRCRCKCSNRKPLIK